MNETLTARMARWAADLSFDDLSADAIREHRGSRGKTHLACGRPWLLRPAIRRFQSTICP